MDDVLSTKSLKKKNGRRHGLLKVRELEIGGCDPRVIRDLEKRVIEKSKKPRKPPEKVKSKLLKVRLTENQQQKLQAYADKKEVTVSQIICDYINRLPGLKDDC